MLKIKLASGKATVLADFDFETYSDAGYNFCEETQKWVSVVKSPPHGIGAVGASAYAEHRSTEVLSLAYDLKEGEGRKIWLPGMKPPTDLFAHIAGGGLLEACNSGFEYEIWQHVCVKRMGWPPLPLRQLRDVAAKARAYSAPGSLGDMAKVLELDTLKQVEGKRLIRKFCCPRNPTKKDLRRRILMADEPLDAARMVHYNEGDIITEAQASAKLPDLQPQELKMWLYDQEINQRGVHINTKALHDCISVVEQTFELYVEEISELTGGAVTKVSEIKRMREWLEAQGVVLPGLAKEVVEEALKDDTIQGPARRMLELRSLLGSASVKKLYAIERRLSEDDRLRQLFVYCGADRTGRFAGRGPQPQNLPNSGPKVKRCVCGKHYRADAVICPWCNQCASLSKPASWGFEAVIDAFEVIATRNLENIEATFGPAITLVGGCLRGLFSAAPGHELISSDYSAIEAVVVAFMSGEQWRMDVFNTHGKIYEMSASKLTGIPFEDMMAHVRETGEHHPSRKKLGKVAELASAYGGGLGAWLAFGADAHLSEQEIKEAVNAWRDESPMVVAFWHGLEKAAANAIRRPGEFFEYRGIGYGVRDAKLFCYLLSGRILTYHNPLLIPGTTSWGKQIERITYMGWNTDYKKGPKGWMRLDTWGGKLVENVVQATARDILANAMIKLEDTGRYPIVMHVHDETVSEVKTGTGAIEEYEEILAVMPEWARDWPVKAAGGWRGIGYRK